MSKRQQQRNEKQLQELIAKVPGNNQCADCRARNPGWASWSLGIFLCMRCAALHRKLGTHISKVKSISLDTWTNDQVEMMKRTGNVTSNAVWNPDTVKYPPPVDLEDSESIMERYIRDKYEHGKFRKDSSQAQSRLSPSSAGAGLTRHPSPGPRTSSKEARSTSPFESKGKRILGMSGSGSVSTPVEYEAKVAKLKDMGFGDEKQNMQVLKNTKGNMERAVEILISLGGGTTSPVPPPKDRPVVKKQRSGLMLGGVKESHSSGGNPFDQLDQQEAAQQQQQQQQLQAQQAPQIHAPQPQQAPQQLFVNGQNGIIQNGMMQNGLSPAGYNPFLQPQVTGYQQPVQQQQQQQVYMNGNGQYVQNPYQQGMLQQQQPQTQQFGQPQQGLNVQVTSPWGDIPPPPQPQYAVSHYTGSSSQQSPISATNPFFNMQQTNPYMASQPSPFQQTFTPPLSQQATGVSPLLFQQQQSQALFQDPNQALLQQQQLQQAQLQQQQQQFPQNGGLAPMQPLVVQTTGRADKSTILQLYNYPQLAPTPSSIQQAIPGQPQQRSVSTPVFQSSGSNNPFASKMNMNGGSGTASPALSQNGFPASPIGRGHMTQESLDFGSLQSGRHSPDAFASLSASFRHR